MANKKDDWEMITKLFEIMYFSVKDGVLEKYTPDLGNPAWLPKEIKVPQSVKAIAQYAFWQVPTLQKIHLPTTVVRIDVNAFANCTKLKEVVYEGTPMQWQKVFVHPNAFCSQVKVKCLEKDFNKPTEKGFVDVATSSTDNDPTRKNKPNPDDYFIDVDKIDDTW